MIHLLLSMALFLAPSDPRLNEKAEPICPCKIASTEVQGIIDQMQKVAFGETQDRSRAILVGLAAPQIGIQKRIILVDTAATGVFTQDSGPPPPQIQVYINPEILWKSETLTQWREGCFSTGSVCGIVPRAQKILIRAYDSRGHLLTEEFEGYVARIFQHEIDHLDGIRFPDRISNEEDLHWVEREELPQYRLEWAHWSKRCPRTKWEEIAHARHPQ